MSHPVYCGHKTIDISEGAKRETKNKMPKRLILITSNAVQRYERASSSTIEPVLSTLTIWIDSLEFFSSFCRCFMLRPPRLPLMPLLLFCFVYFSHSRKLCTVSWAVYPHSYYSNINHTYTQARTHALIHTTKTRLQHFQMMTARGVFESNKNRVNLMCVLYWLIRWLLFVPTSFA